jgi:hypothetical protein
VFAWVACNAWGGLAYGLTEDAEDIAARLGLRVTRLDHALLGGVMIIAATMLVYVFDQSS